MSENSPPKSFNLVTEPWIPIAGVGLVSLNDIFTNEFARLGGTPIEKVVILRLLLCIVHASMRTRLRDLGDWHELNDGRKEMASTVLKYLEQSSALFDLYDEKSPFLQFPQLKGQFHESKSNDPNALSLSVSSGNKSVLTQWNVGTKPSSAELARLILCGSCYGMGGGKYDPDAKVDPNTKKRKKESGKASAPQGTLTGKKGYLHSFMLGNTLWETIMLNILTDEERQDIRGKQTEMDLGKPFWESMPEDEDGETAKKYRSTYLGTLFPIDKFFYLEGEELHMTQGIKYPSHRGPDPKKPGDPTIPPGPHWDPGITIYQVKDNFNAVWCTQECAPWRQLKSLLQFLDLDMPNTTNPAFVIKGIEKLQGNPKITAFGLWVGGIEVSDNSGEQYISGQNDYLSSEFLIPLEQGGKRWFAKFKDYLKKIEDYSEGLKDAVNAYFACFQDKTGKQGPAATRLFWEKMAPYAQSIISLSEEKDPEKIKKAKQDWRQIALSCYDEFCPHETPRQMRAYTQNIPDFRPRKNNNDKKKGGKK